MKSPKILIVDDEGPLREILRKILVKEGFVVDTAKDGREGLQKLKADSYGLLITDLRMPVKEGSELLIETEKIQPEIKVIVVTGYPLDPETKKKVELGRYCYFAKPFENAQLIEKVKELVG